MFGFGKKDKMQKAVGAARKRMEAQRILAGESGEIESKREGKKSAAGSQTILVIYIFALMLAFFLSEFYFKSHSFSTGVSGFDRLFLSASYPAITGEYTLDQIIAIMLRALGIMLVTGIVPGLAYVANRVADRVSVNIYHTVWMVLLLLLLFWFGFENNIRDTLRHTAEMIF